MELAGVMSLAEKGKPRMEILNLFTAHHYKSKTQGKPLKKDESHSNTFLFYLVADWR